MIFPGGAMRKTAIVFASGLHGVASFLQPETLQACYLEYQCQSVVGWVQMVDDPSQDNRTV